jgi:hypothetical protein
MYNTPLTFLGNPHFHHVQSPRWEYSGELGKLQGHGTKNVNISRRKISLRRKGSIVSENLVSSFSWPYSGIPRYYLLIIPAIRHIFYVTIDLRNSFGSWPTFHNYRHHQHRS